MKIRHESYTFCELRTIPNFKFRIFSVDISENSDKLANCPYPDSRTVIRCRTPAPRKHRLSTILAQIFQNATSTSNSQVKVTGAYKKKACIAISL